MKFLNGNKLRLVLLLAVATIVSACDSDSSAPVANPPAPPPPPPAASYTVTFTNLTNAQPLSPVGVIAHQDGYAVFAVGSPASQGLEGLAEGGDNSALLAEANADATVVVTNSGAAPIGPGGSESITLDVLDSDRPGLRISATTMLVNTNDAFTGINGVAVDTLAVGDTMRFDSIAYDAGTEADTELAAEIPGPVGGGEGFNAARDDQGDRVSMHSGVISQDDGLVTSDLTGQHRFDNPVVRVLIERTL
ncbi:MAG: hypothetical protein HOI35_08455 [Woeseia sp.]|jgi:hypothetical protein|nr:hypothetical protein [Woeseia sp.]MBT6210033.1 hypothetical protein [Woeseia sp.]